jgi:hypothetical protein
MRRTACGGSRRFTDVHRCRPVELELEDLLAEHLERIRDPLSAHTATLLLEDSAPFLVATAARGIRD